MLFLCNPKTVTRHRPRRRSQQTQWSRSFPPEVARENAQLEEEVFFERPAASPSSPQLPEVNERGSSEVDALEQATLESLDSPIRYTSRSSAPGWRRDRQNVVRVVGEQTRPTIGGSRILSSMLDRVLDNSNRRQYGMGWVGKMFG